MSANSRIAVVGAGIAGLSAAFRLVEAGHEVTVFEKSPEPGGRTKTVRKNGFTIDVGAGLLPATYVDVIRLMRDAGLDHLREFIDGYAAVHRDGKFYRLNLKRPQLSLAVSGLLGWRSKLKFFTIARHLRRMGAALRSDSLSGAAAFDTESLAQFAGRELNEEILDFFLEPFIRTLYLHDADEGSVVETFWCLKNLAANSSFFIRDGMQRLAEELAAGLDIRFRCDVVSVARDGGGCQVSYRSNGGTDTSQVFDACIVATDTHDLVRMLHAELNDDQRAFISQQKYATSINLHFGLMEAPVEPSLLIQVPKSSDPFLAAIVQDHKKSADRAPAGKGLISVFFMSAWGELMWDKSDEEVITDAVTRIENILPGFTDLIEMTHVERWRHAATIGETGRYRSLAAFEESLDPGGPIQLASDVFAPSSVNVAVCQGERAASRIVARFETGF